MCNLHTCLANIASLNTAKSLKPNPPSDSVYIEFPNFSNEFSFDHHTHPTKTFELAFQYHGKVPQVVWNNS